MRDIELNLENEPVREVEVEKELTYKNNKKLRVYNDLKNGRKLIDISAAYFLGFVSVDDFNLMDKGYYVISDQQIMDIINQGYEIEYKEWQMELEIIDVLDEEKNLIDNSQKFEYDNTNNLKIEELKELRDKIISENTYNLSDLNSKKL